MRDEGRGLPVGFDIGKRKGLGMRIISALMAQLQAELTIGTVDQGAEFILDIPLEAPE